MKVMPSETYWCVLGRISYSKICQNLQKNYDFFYFELQKKKKKKENVFSKKTQLLLFLKLNGAVVPQKTRLDNEKHPIYKGYAE